MNMRRLLAATGALLVLLTAAATAGARPRDPAPGGATALEQAREAANVKDPPRSRHDLPAGVLRLSRSELLAAHGQELDISVTLDRAVAQGELELTLPPRWLARSGASDLPYARVARSGRAAGSGVRAQRSSNVVRLAFDSSPAGATASLRTADIGIPAGRYELPYRWSEDGRPAARGTAEVIFYAPVREEGEGDVPPDWRTLMREVNATANGLHESETFVTAVPGNRQRYVVGANSLSVVGLHAWITNTGGASFTTAAMSASIDAPGEAGPESADLCCDPMSAADAAGNLWYGGLSLENGAGNPSRIVVARAAAPSATTFGPTVGLRTRTGVEQDKPMMTIDNSPASPRYGRLYVVWNELASGVNILMSYCDTRPGAGQVLNAALCDNADNWSVPVRVTPSQGSYIYADVATGPDGRVYVVWWDYSSANAIRGDVCDVSANCASASSWGTPQTIATLDSTGGAPVPFMCPIVAQPGGRASTSPQVDVDRSGGPNHGRVYVTWGDLRSDSGATRCGPDPFNPGLGRAPAATHLTWDSFVASAPGALPGGSGASATVATPLLTDGDGGGAGNSDDWFPWLSVDQTTGIAWADFYSTRHDPTRTTTHFYTRAVAPTAEGHALGPLRRTSTAPSDYSANQCCDLGNDYGDYTGIDATQGFALPVWSDKRAADGEAFVDTVQTALVVPAARSIDDSPAAGGDGDGVFEPGESVRVDQQLRNVGTIAATGVTAGVAGQPGSGVAATSASAYPDIAAGATQGNRTPMIATMTADAPCGRPVALRLHVTVAGEPAVVPLATMPTAACPPPPPPLPPPVAPPPPAVQPAADRFILFALTAKSTQKPPTSKRGIVATLSCPQESCRVTIGATLTVPARTRARTRRYKLKSSTVQVTAGSAKRHTFKVTRTPRAQVARALRSARTRRGVKVVVTATARDSAGNTSRKTKTIRVRR